MEFARKLGQSVSRGTIIGLKGSLGAGKTTFTKGFALGLDIEEPITSPTYTLIMEYNQGRLPFYHMDLYRISDEEEFALLGAEEMIYGEGVSLIEWYEQIRSFLPPKIVEISIEIGHDQSRTIQVKGWKDDDTGD